MAFPEKETVRKLREAAFKRQRGLCIHCGTEMIRFRHETWNDPMVCTAEHIIPRSHGGRATEDNIAAAHKICNETRGNAPVNHDSH